MILFVSGDDKNIIEILTELDEDICISEILASATCPMLKKIIPWAKRVGIPVTLHFPESLELEDIVKSNSEIIRRERPDMIMSLVENDLVQYAIIEKAKSYRIDYVYKNAVSSAG